MDAKLAQMLQELLDAQVERYKKRTESVPVGTKKGRDSYRDEVEKMYRRVSWSLRRKGIWEEVQAALAETAICTNLTARIRVIDAADARNAQGTLFDLFPKVDPAIITAIGKKLDPDDTVSNALKRLNHVPKRAAAVMEFRTSLAQQLAPIAATDPELTLREAPARVERHSATVQDAAIGASVGH